MKSKKLISLAVLILGLISLVLLFVNLPKILPPKPPQTLKDLAYDSDKRLGYTIYIPENGKLEPYLVLTKNYDKQGNVLLIRKYVLDVGIQHNETHKSAYYAESIPDRFMNELFIKEFPKVLQQQIITTSINITDEKSVLFRKNSEIIQRKLFLLLERELGDENPITSDEQRIRYFSDNRFSNLVAKTKDAENVLWWLRGVDRYNRLDYAAAVMDNGYTDYASVMSRLGLRPSFCLPPNTKIAKETINGQDLYVLKAFQNLKLPRAALLAEDIGLTGHDLEKYYIKHGYFGLEIDLKNPQYGGVLSDNLTVPKGERVLLRAKTFSDGQFDGWYLDDKLISREKELSYQVMQNETLIAKFSAVEETKHEK